MSKYIALAVMEAESPGIYDILPAQFRDRIPADVFASPQNAMIFRSSFDVLPGLVNNLFAQLRYRDGSVWPMWKLVAAFYLVEVRIGASAVSHTGAKIYSTMPWPAQVHSIADALRFTDTAYFESHLRAPRTVAGSWRVESQTASTMVVADDTPYPCHLNEGVVAGICRAFARQSPVYRMIDAQGSKRAGGTVTRYEVVFTPP